jgi:nucleotide-binding universal stress UspA family protein
MYNHILVPLDGSGLAERALSHAESLAGTFGATIHLVQVVSRLAEVEAAGASGVGATTGAEANREADRQVIQARISRSREYLQDIAARLQVEGISVETASMEGVPDEQITQYAKENGVDLITISTHGYGGLRRFFLGSVTDKIIRSSDIPVLVLPAR